MKLLSERKELCKQYYLQFQLKSCLQECKDVLIEDPKCREIRFYQAFCLSFFKPYQSLELFNQIFEDHPDYFECLTQHLDVMTIFPEYTYLPLIGKIKKSIDAYEGEKDRCFSRETVIKCRETRFYQAFCLSFSIPSKSIELFDKIFDDHPNYFECITQHLDIITGLPLYQHKAQIEKIKKSIDAYEGEKDVFYYTSSCLAERLIGELKFYKQQLDTAEDQFKNLSDYESAVLTHQIGGYYLYKYEFSVDEEEMEQNRIKALNYFEISLKLSPNHIYNILNIACLYFSDYTKASYMLGLVQKAYGLAPEDDKVIAFLCSLLHQRGRVIECFEILKKKLNQHPSILSLYLYVDLCKYDFGDKSLKGEVEIPFIINCMKECVKEDSLSVQNLQTVFKFQFFCKELKLGCKPLREIMIFFMETNVFSLFEFEKQQDILELDHSQDIHDTVSKVVEEMKETVSNILQLIAYAKIAQNELSFQQNLSHLDLCF